MCLLYLDVLYYNCNINISEQITPQNTKILQLDIYRRYTI